MDEEEYDEDEYFKCRKCKLICEKIINEKTNKPYTLCGNCRAKCGSKNKKNKEENEDEPPLWKQKLFNMTTNKKENHINLEDVDVETETEQTENNDENDDEPKTINGQLMAGMVENIDDIKKNISSLSLNDKMKYIIDLLETSNNKGQKATTTDDKNEKIYDMLYEMKATINKDVIDIKNELKAMKQNIIDIKNNII